MSNFLTTTLERLRSRPRVTGVVVRIVATYVLLGAAAKVLWGAPSDLPAALLQMVRWDEQVLFDLVIFVELFVAGLAIVSPKIGWPLVSAALTGFVIVLVQQLRGGETSCGCFGSALTVPTQVMLGIDLLALTGMALVQPWSSLRSTLWRAWAVVPAPLLAMVGVWYVHSATIAPLDPPPDLDVSALVNQTSDTPENDQVVVAPPPTSRSPSPPPSEPITSQQPPAPKESDWRLPARLPRIITLRPPDWINQPLRECALATWADTSKMPEDCTLIFYYDTCTHCAEHIKAKADSADRIDYVFIQLPTARNSRYPRVVHELPRGLWVKLPAGPRWQLETPWDVLVWNGIVINATKGL